MSISLGEIIFIAVKPIFKIYLVMIIGFILVKANILTMETSRGISNMVVNALIPCLTFNKVVGNLSGSEIKEIGVFILTTLLIFATGFALACVALFITPVPHEWRFGILFAGIFANIADLPIAYVQSMGAGSIFSSKQVDGAVALNCIFLAVQQFLIQNCGMFQIVGLDFREADNDNEAVSEVELEYLSTKKDADPELDVAAIMDQEDQEVKNRRFSLTSRNITRARSYESGGSLRSIERVRSNTIRGIIDEYSEAERIRSINNMDALSKTISKAEFIGLKDSSMNEENSMKDRKWSELIKKYKLGWLEYILINSVRVPSVVLLLSFIIAMIPWLRALFVKNSVNMHSAPDGLPPLNFLMDFTAYLGNACVPMGLLLLGGTLARLQIKQIPKGFWKSVVFMVCARLMVMPVIGILWSNQLYRSNWVDDDISRFLICIGWSVPSATAQVYFTAFYTPLEGTHEQLDCLAVLLLAQYPVLIVTLPIVVSYVLKVSLGF